MSTQALLLVAPEAACRKEEVIHRITQHGIAVVQQRRVRLSEEEAIDFFQTEMDEPGFDALIQHVTGADIVVLEVAHADIFTQLDLLIGSSLDMEKPETLSAVYAVSGRKQFHYSQTATQARLEIQFFFPGTVVEPLIANHDIQLFLEDAIYPTLLKGLTLLCKNKPANPTEWLGLWLLANDPEKPLVVDLEN